MHVNKKLQTDRVFALHYRVPHTFSRKKTGGCMNRQEDHFYVTLLPMWSKVISKHLEKYGAFFFVDDTQSQLSACYKTEPLQPKETHVVQNVKQKQIFPMHRATKATELLCLSSSLFLIYCKTAAAPDTMKPLFSRKHYKLFSGT